jgi:predicted RNA binding protein YcfA (HicA-like mRNA interferase family)
MIHASKILSNQFTPELFKTSGSSLKLIKDLKDDGWVVDRQTGSHITLQRPPHPHIITVPHPQKDLHQGLERRLRKEMGCANNDPAVKKV